MTTRKQLKELAQKVALAKRSPLETGEWFSSDSIRKDIGTEAAVWGEDGDCIAFVYGNLGLDRSAKDLADFIAAASPDLIITLINRIEELESRL